MSELLLGRFYELTEATSLKLLESQWHFDKQIIPKALQNIGQIFPHYSRHDQSHSEQILVNIERILGKRRIGLLSATDIWLLLEAAYWHDIGMVIPRKALLDVFSNPDFDVYRRQVAADNGNELQKFAKYFKGNSSVDAFAGADTPLDAVEKFRLFMAEWFRRQHAQNSEKCINDPWQELGISSPRTELIPKRLFRWLGRICAMHGGTFSDVLNLLPHKEVGMANDDCHPRFIACLLRLGDLLDLDDNRFCPVLQHLVGDDRPIVSVAHEDKHRSIRNFRLNSDRIEIKAVCETIDGYVEQWRWLDYLKDEIQNQMARWLDIAPSPELGLLPTLGEISVEIAGRQLITKPGKRQEFTLNSTRVMTLLRGENLYKGEDAVRELLQNSVDATLLRVWLTAQSQAVIIGNKPDRTSEEYLKQFPISVILERIKNPDVPIRPGGIMWRFTVVDQGIGIAQADVQFMINVAGSSANIKRQILIDSMPEWMQPSGTFGIGLQSAFMRTDEVQIETKSFYTHESMDISLHSPTGQKRGLVTMERSDDSYMRPVGTRLSFTIITDSSPYGHPIKNDDRLTSLAFHSYDPLLDEELPLAAYKILDAANNFAKNSLIPVCWTFNNGSDQELHSAKVGDTTDSIDNFYTETNSKFSMEIALDDRRGSRSELYFRGQRVAEAGLSSYYFLNYKLDLYAGKAGDWLTFDRNRLASGGERKISEIVRKNIRLWVNRNRAKLLLERKNDLSLIAKLWSADDENEDDAFWEQLSNEIPDEWLNSTCEVSQNGKAAEAKYCEVLTKGTILCAKHYKSEMIDVYDACICFVDESILQLLVDQWCHNRTHGIRYLHREIRFHSRDTKILVTELIEVEGEANRLVVDEETLMVAIERAAYSNDFVERILLPIEILPAQLNFQSLKLKNGIRLYGIKYCLEYLPERAPHVILPFEIQYGTKQGCSIKRLDEFVIWLRDNMANPTSVDSIKSVCLQLINYIDNTVMQTSVKWKQLRSNAE